jgi:hypothetical protein
MSSGGPRPRLKRQKDLASGRIEYRILQGGVTRRQAADHQPPVHRSQHLIKGGALHREEGSAVKGV